MAGKKWENIRIPSKRENSAWELFHENSKTSKYGEFLPDEAILAQMARIVESLPFDRYPVIPLPISLTPLQISLETALLTRTTARSMRPCFLTLENVATILYYAYGITRDNKDTPFPRPFRTIPSGGALYPLDIFFHSTYIRGLEAGLYHYNPISNNLRFLRNEDLSSQISNALVLKHVAFDTSLLLFITAMFERSTFKYGNRGYRFILLEAGHLAQNINLVSNALGLGSMNIGGYFDRQIDELLGLDGVTHSTIYMIGIGEKIEASQAEEGRIEL